MHRDDAQLEMMDYKRKLNIDPTRRILHTFVQNKRYIRYN